MGDSLARGRARGPHTYPTWPGPRALGHRLDVALCKSEAVTLVFLPASDIASYVGDGDVDMGITGEDIIEETGCVTHPRHLARGMRTPGPG